MYSIFPPKNINAQGKKSLPQEHDRKEKVNKSGAVFSFFSYRAYYINII
jgi:hypothetical protein